MYQPTTNLINRYINCHREWLHKLLPIITAYVKSSTTHLQKICLTQTYCTDHLWNYKRAEAKYRSICSHSCSGMSGPKGSIKPARRKTTALLHRLWSCYYLGFSLRDGPNYVIPQDTTSASTRSGRPADNSWFNRWPKWLIKQLRRKHVTFSGNSHAMRI